MTAGTIHAPAPTLAPATAIASAKPVLASATSLPAHAAHIHIVVSNSRDGLGGDASPQGPGHPAAGDDEGGTASHSPSLSYDDSPCDSTDADIEQLIRDAVHVAASEGASPEAVENATQDAVMKLRFMRAQPHHRRQTGKKRKKPATTSLAEPARETASNSDIPQVVRA